MIAGWLARIGRPALLLAGLLGAGLLLRGAPVSGFAAAASSYAGSPAGPLAFVAVGGALCAVGVPRQMVTYAAGYVFGLWGGAGLALLAQMAGCVADFVWARALARGWVQRRVGPRLRHADRFLAASPFAATLVLRLLPIGNNLALNLLAGVSSLPAGRFFAGSALGYVPQTLVFCLLGTGVRLDRTAEIAVGIVLFGVSTAIGMVLFGRLRRVAPAAGLCVR
jgi:uncharacterized membrane protein YdjX (TVP38/TMEM64 family)